MQLHVESKKHLNKMQGAGGQGAAQMQAALAAWGWDPSWGMPPMPPMAMPGGGGGWGSGGAAAPDASGGCQACSLPGPLNPNHFESKVCKKAHEKMAAAMGSPQGGGFPQANPVTQKPKAAGKQTLVGGCEVCGVAGPLNPNHFESKKCKAAHAAAGLAE